MADTVKVKAMRFALQAAKSDYGAYPGDVLADVIAYLTVKVRAQTPPRPAYPWPDTGIIVGKPTGKYRCLVCKQTFGENDISPAQSKRAYLTLNCPHCLHSWFEDRSR